MSQGKGKVPHDSCQQLVALARPLITPEEISRVARSAAIYYAPRNDLEDVVQKVHLKILSMQANGTFEPNEDPLALVHRIARNTAIDTYRKHARDRERLADRPLDSVPDQSADPAESNEQEIVTHLRDSLRLTEHEILLIVERVLRRQSWATIASDLSRRGFRYPPATLRTQWTRLRKKLRRRLAS